MFLLFLFFPFSLIIDSYAYYSPFTLLFLILAQHRTMGAVVVVSCSVLMFGRIAFSCVCYLRSLQGLFVCCNICLMFCPNPFVVGFVIPFIPRVLLCFFVWFLTFSLTFLLSEIEPFLHCSIVWHIDLGVHSGDTGGKRLHWYPWCKSSGRLLFA